MSKETAKCSPRRAVLDCTSNRNAITHTSHASSGFSQRYTNHDIVKYLESIGAEFGACQNAYTSADDTVYEFLVPTDDVQVLKNSFDVFADFATKIRSGPTVVTTGFNVRHV